MVDFSVTNKGRLQDEVRNGKLASSISDDTVDLVSTMERVRKRLEGFPTEGDAQKKAVETFKGALAEIEQGVSGKGSAKWIAPAYGAYASTVHDMLLGKNGVQEVMKKFEQDFASLRDFAAAPIASTFSGESPEAAKGKMTDAREWLEKLDKALEQYGNRNARTAEGKRLFTDPSRAAASVEELLNSGGLSNTDLLRRYVQLSAANYVILDEIRNVVTDLQNARPSENPVRKVGGKESDTEANVTSAEQSAADAIVARVGEMDNGTGITPIASLLFARLQYFRTAAEAEQKATAENNLRMNDLALEHAEGELSRIKEDLAEAATSRAKLYDLGAGTTVSAVMLDKAISSATSQLQRLDDDIWSASHLPEALYREESKKKVAEKKRDKEQSLLDEQVANNPIAPEKYKAAVKAIKDQCDESVATADKELARLRALRPLGALHDEQERLEGMVSSLKREKKLSEDADAAEKKAAELRKKSEDIKATIPPGAPSVAPAAARAAAQKAAERRATEPINVATWSGKTNDYLERYEWAKNALEANVDAGTRSALASGTMTEGQAVKVVKELMRAWRDQAAGSVITKAQIDAISDGESAKMLSRRALVDYIARPERRMWAGLNPDQTAFVDNFLGTNKVAKNATSAYTARDDEQKWEEIHEAILKAHRDYLAILAGQQVAPSADNTAPPPPAIEVEQPKGNAPPPPPGYS